MSLKRLVLLLLIVLAFIAVAVIGARAKRIPEAQRVACPDPVQGCGFMHRGTPVQLKFSRAPSSMQPFTLRLRAPGVSRVRAEFQMAGMDMGFNRYDLHAVAPGPFTASITLPVCVSGRRDWMLYLEVGQDRYALSFKS
jgi:hypothetical protein